MHKTIGLYKFNTRIKTDWLYTYPLGFQNTRFVVSAHWYIHVLVSFEFGSDFLKMRFHTVYLSDLSILVHIRLKKTFAP